VPLSKRPELPRQDPSVPAAALPNPRKRPQRRDAPRGTPWGVSDAAMTVPHNLPFSSLGPLFQGREEMISLLREKLTQTPSGRATAIAGKAVHSLGGVGKTRLAVEYAGRYAADYIALLFVGADSPAYLRRNLAALCDRNVLDLPEKDTP
jgi:hypothetical protein